MDSIPPLSRFVALATILAWSASSGVNGQALPTERDLATEAIIGQRAARFVFPAEASDRLTWPSPIAHAYAGLPTMAWEVDWSRSLSAERFGIDPNAIVLVVRWRAERAREWTLAALLARSRPEVLTFCRSCETPAAIPRADPAVRVAVEGRRVVFTVRGREAVRRLFPVVPDSVSLTRRTWNEADARSVRVAVERREP